MKNFKNKSVNAHQFAMIPKTDIPRSTMRSETNHKTTFDAGYLVPIFVDEVLPGDSFKLNMTAFARLATPLFPIMDNLHLDSFFFFVPNRLVWANWVKFQGEQANPGDSISYTIPQVVSPASGFAVGSLYDYMGLPTVGQITAAQTISVNALPLRAYNEIYNEWFRDENLQNSTTVLMTDGPDPNTNYTLLRRGKRFDYFTSALPWPQKGNIAVSLPLGTSAPLKSNAGSVTMYGTAAGAVTQLSFPAAPGNVATAAATTAGAATYGPAGTTVTGMYADLSAATAATINQLRQAFTIQQLLEKDARGGTRYTEIILSHFGVKSPDARLQRPEYLGGGTTAININPIAQTSATGVTGGSAPLATLSAMGTTLASGHGFSQSFTEHGYIIGLISVRADLNYQQGLRKMWSRLTRYDFYMPTFANLGEQAILNKEIYCVGTPAQDDGVFGYQERWAEYRYFPTMITGLFRSTSAGTIDPWHLAQRFTALPTLNATFISDTPPLSRTLAVGAAANGQQLIADCFFNLTRARPMPLYSVPGLTRL